MKFKRKQAEAAVLEAIASQLFTPAAVDEFLDLVAQEHAAQSGSGQERPSILQRSLTEVKKGIDNCMKFVLEGTASVTVAATLKDLEEKQLKIQGELDRLAVQQPITPRELDDLRGAAKAALGDLAEILTGTPAETRQVLSGLIKDGLVTPAADKTNLQLSMSGDIEGLLMIAAAKQRRKPAVPKAKGPTGVPVGPKLVNVVARARSGISYTTESTVILQAIRRRR